MREPKPLLYYCDTCRGIREHYGLTILGARSILCINWRDHWHMEWCRTCGNRIDNGDCAKAFEHTPRPCQPGD